MERTEYQRKVVAVYGDHVAKEKNRIPAYERVIETREITFTCKICKKSVTQERFPSKNLYCGEECQREGKRIKTRKRVQKLREKRRQQKQIQPSEKL